ncbi:hypothetical protein JHK86_003497 [Glycine max]|nr:hypothetical protein JHK86_003497 [Glycine max]
MNAKLIYSSILQYEHHFNRKDLQDKVKNNINMIEEKDKYQFLQIISHYSKRKLYEKRINKIEKRKGLILEK